MIKNYLTIAWRNLLKHKSFSFINILGLAIGIAACIIISLYVHNELTYDQYNKKADRIARITITIHAPESDVVLATTPTPLADVLKNEYPEVESAVRLESSPQIIKFNHDLFKEEAFFKTDAAIFSIFDFDFIEGHANDALKNPNSIVIAETIAKKYFAGTNAVGKTIITKDQTLLVTGVVKDRPANSDMKIDALMSNDFSKTKTWMDDFEDYTFILFNKKTDLKIFANKISAISKKYLQPELDAQGGTKYQAQFLLQPLIAVHFDEGKLLDTTKGNKQFNYIFSLLAVFILVIALLNYINLSTAKSSERAKEVGIRKVSGALRFQLIKQFLVESFFLVAIAWIFALAFVAISLPFFNKLLQTQLSVDLARGSLLMIAAFILTFLLAGLYPAFVLSGFMPVKVLKGSWRHSIKGIFLRKAVTVTQFAIAAALIMGATIIYSQMKYIRQKDLGYNKDQVLSISLPDDSVLRGNVKSFQNDLKQRPEVRDVTVGASMNFKGGGLSSFIASNNGKKRELMCYFLQIDPHYLSVFQMHLLEGRNLSDSFSTDKNEAFLVNEAYVKMMGWKSGLGQKLEGTGRKGTIVGVVKNFYFKSLHNMIEPLMLIYNNNPDINTTTVKINPQYLPVVKEIYKKNFPANTFDYAFYDEMFEKQYEKDKMTMSLFNEFTVLAIFVSCLGLYGLVALIAVQRTKEIGIRKVLGASLQQLFSLMSKDFVALLIIALFIALPLAAFFMNKWLNGYAYHVQLSWWMFLVPVFLLLIITIVVISKEIIKTALINPVKSLRTE